MLDFGDAAIRWREYPRRTVLRLIRRAQESGPLRGHRALSRHRHEWDISGECLTPVSRGLLGRRYRDRPADPAETTLFLLLHVRCRACKNCLAKRGSVLAAKALWEIRNAPRTWFGTLTISEEEQYRAEAVAIKEARERGVVWTDLAADRKFAARVRVLGREATLMFKRWRKAGAHFRYCLVCEKHKSGDPHFHILVHEVWGRDPVTNRALKFRRGDESQPPQWPLGFVRWKLVGDSKRGAWYVAKYVAKAKTTRLRVSGGYGRGSVRRERSESRV